MVIFIILEILLYTFIKATNSVFKDFSLNLITEIIGIFITIFFIDLVLKNKERREQTKILKNVFSQFKRPTRNLLNLFVKFYKAASLEVPSDSNTNFRTILSSEKFYNNVQYLDFLKPAPVVPHQAWLIYTSYEVKEIKELYEKIIDKYAFVLDSKLLEDIEWIINNSLLMVLSMGSRITASDQALNVKRDHFLMLAKNEEMIKELIDKIFEVCDYFEKVTKIEADLNYSEALWQDNMGPKVSSGRYTGK